MKKINVFIASLLSLLLIACGSQDQTSDKPSIVTTFYPVYEFTRQIVGDEADVQLLIDAGTEVHDFEPSAKDVAVIEEADTLVYANENMEIWIPEVQKNLKKAKSSVKTISATEGMLLLPGSEEGHDHAEGEDHNHAYDPHVWVSPYRAIKMVESLRDSLIKQYPDKKDVYTKNAATYLKKLKALDKTYTDSLSQAKQKSFVTQHTAFAYLALDYGLTQVSVNGLTPENEPSASRLAELADYIKTYDIKYIYFEETASSRVAETLAAETKVKTAVLNPLESLTQKAMDDGKDYISAMEDNLKALQLTTEQAGPDVQPESGQEDKKTVYNGYFEDADIKDRSIEDYQGDWQSVYPYLLDGTLDQVWDYKAKAPGASMTADEYKTYYDTGYKTDVDQIKIKGDTMDFIVDGKSHKYTYKYVGYKVLTYEKGNRGVRYLFEATDSDAGPYKYVQFSDHAIAPVDTGHFHIYFGGESQEKLLEELENWPTYYPTGLSGFDIAQEMLAH